MNCNNEKIEVYNNGVYATPVYEMEVYKEYFFFDDTEKDEVTKFTDDLKEYHAMKCTISKFVVGLYLTKEEALETYREMIENPEENIKILAMQIREKPLGCAIRKGTYINAWSYDAQGNLLDESVGKTYDDEYPYYGRPADMIHHKAGDIVQYINEDGKWCWGIILGPPPTVEQLAKRNKHLKEVCTLEEDTDSYYCWSTDSYLIITGKDNDTEFALPTDVFKPMHKVPDFVKNTLTEVYNEESKKDISYF